MILVKCLLANRILMFFPGSLMLNNLVELRVVTTSGHVQRVHGATSKEILSRALMHYYCTINWCRVIQFFESLGKKFFPLPSQLYPILSSRQSSGSLICSFILECLHLYLSRKIFNFVLVN